MVVLTQLYICFIAYMHVHETEKQRRIEMLNECILLGTCYHFYMLVDPNIEQSLKDDLGTSIVVFISSLLGINTLIIIGVNIQAICHKLKLRKLRKLAEAR